MDPDATLARIREAIEQGDGRLLVELIFVLDEWLSSGGFLPKDWDRERP